MTEGASQITSLTIVYSAVHSGGDQRKCQSSASLVFVRGIHRRSVNSPRKGPVMRKMFPFGDVIMFDELCSQGFNWQYFVTGSNNGLPTRRCPTIIWSNDLLVYQHIYALISFEELTLVSCISLHMIMLLVCLKSKLLHLPHQKDHCYIHWVFFHSCIMPYATHVGWCLNKI